ncbi:allantoate permease [Ophiostoma piceae UAMH 11346]|uniref:Allantoate permease n=1 Tax=Ophiostoma piceae (strain UAMH 11346) TaxID=1262450 RepID=S3D6C2_OPHP1|nr:allantoate permease [Ophiostoma piceae UAMH 11346]
MSRAQSDDIRGTGRGMTDDGGGMADDLGIGIERGQDLHRTGEIDEIDQIGIDSLESKGSKGSKYNDPEDPEYSEDPDPGYTDDDDTGIQLRPLKMGHHTLDTRRVPTDDDDIDDINNINNINAETEPILARRHSSHDYDEEEDKLGDSSLDLFPKKTSWRSYIWDTWDRPPAERQFLHKLDAVVLTFASIGYFLKTLDQTNVYNAFLSGMKEELEMNGNELVTSTTLWTIGYVLGQIPATILLTRVSPRWVIPSLEVGWGLATVLASTAQSSHALYLLRFIVGVFESGFYPGIHYMLGSIYTPQELGKRAMIFWLSGSIGKIFSGFLQAAAYENLDGVHGMSGWRWLFIVDGLITLPLALLGFAFFPNLPQSGERTWWLTEAEQKLSFDRMKAIGRAGKQPWTREKVRTIFRSWHTYLLPILYILWNNGSYQNAMGYWLKSFNQDPPPVPGVSFTVGQINNLPIVSTVLFIAMSFTWGWLSDAFKGVRWPFIYLGAFIHLTFGIILLRMPLYDDIEGRKHIYWLSEMGNGAGPLILIWINEICSADTEKRALLVAVANDLAYVVQAIAPNFVWKTTDFPAATRGYTWSIIMQILLVVVTIIIQLLLRRDKKREAHARRERRVQHAEWQSQHQPLAYSGTEFSHSEPSSPTTK